MAVGNILIMFLGLFLYVPLIGLSIFMMVLMIKVMRRGIRALDIYIEKNDPYRT